MLDSFIRTYADRKYKHTATVRHQGMVVAFAMAEANRSLYYSVLDLNAERAKDGRDTDGWLENPIELRFPNEIAQVGYGVADQFQIPAYRKGANTPEPPGERPDDDELDLFMSTTARLTADAPFQVMSDGRFIYLFRQAIAEGDPDMEYATDSYGRPVANKQGKPVPIVNATLLVDRFVLAGSELRPKMEVRYRRSRSKYRPQSRKDSLGAKDMEDRPFYEPTQELDFVRNLSSGRFAALLLPTQVASIQRWQIFAYNSKSGLIDSFNLQLADDGLFNTRGTQFYTCPVHSDVFELTPGACTRARDTSAAGDGAAEPCGLSLIPLALRGQRAESALRFDGTTYVEFESGPEIGEAGWTVELWLKPQKLEGEQVLVVAAGRPLIQLRDDVVEVDRFDAAGSKITAALKTQGKQSWYHLAVTCVGNDCTIWQSGRRIGGASLSSAPAAARIGTLGATTGGFAGDVDEVRVWNRARSIDEINGDSGQRLVGREPGLVAYWRLDEGSGNQIFDQSDYGSAGSLHGGAWVISDAPVGDSAGINRDSFRIDGRTLTGGMAALLYYQQEEVSADGTRRPVKRNARVLLAAATEGGTGDNALAALDFGVSREGKLAQAPDILFLDAKGADRLELADAVEREIELRQDIRDLDTKIAGLSDYVGLSGVVVARTGNTGSESSVTKALTEMLDGLGRRNSLLLENPDPGVQALAAALVPKIGTLTANVQHLSDNACDRLKATVIDRVTKLAVCHADQISKKNNWDEHTSNPFNYLNRLVSQAILTEETAATDSEPARTTRYNIFAQLGDEIKSYDYDVIGYQQQEGQFSDNEPKRLWWFDLISGPLNFNGTYRIQSIFRSKDNKTLSLDATDDNPQDENRAVRAHEQLGNLNQSWRLEKHGDYYTFRVDAHGRWLSVGMGEKLTDMGSVPPNMTTELGDLDQKLNPGDQELVLNRGLPFALAPGMILRVAGWLLTVSAPVERGEKLALIAPAQLGGALEPKTADDKPVKVERMWPEERVRWSLDTTATPSDKGAERITDAKTAYEKQTVLLRASQLEMAHFVKSLEDLFVRVRERAAKQADLDQLTKARIDETPLTMPLLHIDPNGLTVCGAALAFVQTAEAPLLFDSATGSLALYYRDTANHFMVAYYDTATERVQLPLTSSAPLGKLANAIPAGAKVGQIELATGVPRALADGAALRIGNARATVSGSVEKDTTSIPIVPATWTAGANAGIDVTTNDLTLWARSADSELDTLIAEVLPIASDTDTAQGKLCDLKITAKVAGSEVVECWSRVPRDTRKLGGLLNGETGEPILVGRLAAVSAGEIKAIDLIGRVERQLAAGTTLLLGRNRLAVSADPQTLIVRIPIKRAGLKVENGAAVTWLAEDVENQVGTTSALGAAPMASLELTGAANRLLLRKIDDLGQRVVKQLDSLNVMVGQILQHEGLPLPSPEPPAETEQIEALTIEAGYASDSVDQRPLWRLLREGDVLRIGDTLVTVGGPPELLATRVPIETTELEAPAEGLAVFTPEYDYTYATISGMLGDLSGGSLLVEAASAGFEAILELGQRVASGPTAACAWAPRAPGSALALDGFGGSVQNAPEAAPDQFAATGDLTIEAWVRPDYIRDKARIVQHRSAESSYILGLRNVSSALLFDGRSQYVDLGGAGVPASGAFTLEAWIFPAATDDEAQGFLGDYRLENVIVGPALWVTGRTQLAGGFAAVSFDPIKGITTRRFSFVTPENTLATATWQHVAVTFDTSTFRIYVDGRLCHSAAGAPEGNPSLHIRFIGKVDSFFAGAIDEVRVWNRARTGAEIQADQRRRLTGEEYGLVGYWYFGGELRNMARGGAPATANGGPGSFPAPLTSYAVFAASGGRAVESRELIGSGAWSHIASVYNQAYALEFGGGDAHLECGADASLAIGGDLTIEVYLQATSLAEPHGILGKGAPGRGEDMAVPYALWIEAGGRLSFGFEDGEGGWHTWTGKGALRENSFHRVAVIRKQVVEEPKQLAPPSDLDQIDTRNLPAEPTSSSMWVEIRFFVDGTETDVFQYTGRDPGAGDQQLMIGQVSLALRRTLPFLGTISEARIWNVARATKQIGAAISDRDLGLVAWWRFEENGGNVAYDSKGGNHARRKGGVKWIKSPNPAESPLDILIDGLRVVSMPIAMPEPAESAGFFVGAHAASQRYAGLLEELRVWKTARDHEQIQDNMYRRLVGEYQDLIAYYTFDQPAGEVTAAAGAIDDQSLHDNHLRFSGATILTSNAPIADDIPQVRNVLGGVKTSAPERLDGRPGVAEYGDMQYDSAGDLTGILKRSYTYVSEGAWRMVTGFKVGRLVSEWLGQVQFDPQLMGYIEGAPPVPSENLTVTGYVLGEFADYTGASSIELTQAAKTTYTYSASRDIGFKTELEAKLGTGLSQTFYQGILQMLGPTGSGTIALHSVLESDVKFGGQVKFESSLNWLDEASSTVEQTTTKTYSMALRGYVENVDALARPNRDDLPDFGRRFVPENFGYALVQSETADVFALRLEHTRALVTYQIRPNPDIPRDWNIITFPINPHYVKQGTLDGKIGFVPDPDFPNALNYSPDSSYFKPIEAYALKNRIRREEQELRTVYEQFNAWSRGAKGAGEPADKLPNLAKRNLVNTYVWTADGGLFAETEETMDVRQETTGGAFSFSTMAGGNISADFKLGAWLSFELTALAGASLNLEAKKSRESETAFGLQVSLDKVEGDIYWRNEAGAILMDMSNRRNPRPKKMPGKVDAYRFMSYYLEPRSTHFDEFFNKVVDPIWLDQSSDPSASALRQARSAGQQDRRPPCWRVLHRVTYVSRILQSFDDVPVASLEQTLQTLDIDSNYELIKKLEPFVKPHLDQPVEFARALRAAVRDQLPELIPHSDEILQFMRDYYGIYDDFELIGRGERPSLAAQAGRPSNQPPHVDAGADMDVRIGADAWYTLNGTVADDRTPSDGIAVTWVPVQRPPDARVRFKNPFVTQPEVQFDRKGEYVLELRADDGTLASADQVVIVAHAPPQISAGLDFEIGPWGTARLIGQLLESGLGDPRRAYVTFLWEQVRGPGRTSFADASALETTATFTASGAYVLRLTAELRTKGANTLLYTVSKEVTVTMLGRVAGGLEALYVFEDDGAARLRDVSGVGEPLDLTPVDMRRATRVDGGLAVAEPPTPAAIELAAAEIAVAELAVTEQAAVESAVDLSVLATAVPATRIIEAIRASSELTIEAWIAPSMAIQPGLARIVTISGGRAERNLTLGQSGGSYHVALRTTTTNPNASNKALAGGEIVPSQIAHVVCTRERDLLRLYVDGVEADSRVVDGALSNWDPNFRLALGGEIDDKRDGNDRFWSGVYHLIAIYSRALSPSEIAQNFAFGADADLAPVLDAGDDIVVAMVDGVGEAQLNARLVDDRISADQIALRWSAEHVTFTPDNALHTVARFPAPGRYTLHLRAEDLTQHVSDMLRVRVYRTPVVTVGMPLPVIMPNSVALKGVLIDNGLGERGEITFAWSKHEGPGEVMFASTDTLETTATFSRPGRYKLRLTASTEFTSSFDELEVAIYQAPQIDLSGDTLKTLPGAARLFGQIVDSGFGDLDARSTVRWEAVSTPTGGTATFEPGDALATTVTFSRHGIYSLRLSVGNDQLHDEQLTASATWTVVSNAAPFVDAGEDQIVTLPAVAQLDGTASDDGQPNPPGELALEWSMIAGPEGGAVIFADSKTDITTASFTAGGIYTLRLTARDAPGNEAGVSFDDVTIQANLAPVVEAGPNQLITLPARAHLAAVVTDDGLPTPGMLTYLWTVAECPPGGGEVLFEPPDMPETTATFMQSGRYVLRLHVTDGAAVVYDDLTIEANQAPVVDAGPDQVIVLPAKAQLAGTVSDDGMPTLPGAVTVGWKQLSGLPGVQFKPADQATATASFPGKGRYELELTANDGAVVVAKQVTVTVHRAPSISAGRDRAIKPGEVAELRCEISDYGLGDREQGDVTVIWRQLSGPAPAVIEEPNALATTARFAEPGAYELAVEVANGYATAIDQLKVFVSQRVWGGLLTLYTFTEGAGAIVHDVSEDGEPLNLVVSGQRDATRWTSEGLMVVKTALIASRGAATKIIAPVRRAGELTIEAWITPHDKDDDELDRIISIAGDKGHRNITIGADGSKYIVQHLGEGDDDDASRLTAKAITSGKLTHLVYTCDRAGVDRLYINGKELGHGKRQGDFAKWNSTYRLALANEVTLDRPWRGALHLVAIYGRALTVEEIGVNLAAGVAARGQ